MPSKSPAQRRLMAAAAHTKGGYGGVSQAVGREFNQADKGRSMAYSKGGDIANTSYAAGGPVLQPSNSRFLKTPDEFTTGSGRNDENFAKGSKKSKPADKSLSPVKPRK